MKNRKLRVLRACGP